MSDKSVRLQSRMGRQLRRSENGHKMKHNADFNSVLVEAVTIATWQHFPLDSPPEKSVSQSVTESSKSASVVTSAVNN